MSTNRRVSSLSKRNDIKEPKNPVMDGTPKRVAKESVKKKKCKFLQKYPSEEKRKCLRTCSALGQLEQVTWLGSAIYGETDSQRFVLQTRVESRGKEIGAIALFIDELVGNHC